MAMKLKNIKFDMYIFNLLNCDDSMIYKVCILKTTFHRHSCTKDVTILDIYWQTQIKYDLLRGFLSETPLASQSLFYYSSEDASLSKVILCLFNHYLSHPWSKIYLFQLHIKTATPLYSIFVNDCSFPFFGNKNKNKQINW